MGGDHRGAIDDLVALLRDAPADAPWVAAGARRRRPRSPREQSYRHLRPPAAAAPRRRARRDRRHSRPDARADAGGALDPAQPAGPDGAGDGRRARRAPAPEPARRRRLDQADALADGAARSQCGRARRCAPASPPSRATRRPRAGCATPRASSAFRPLAIRPAARRAGRAVRKPEPPPPAGFAPRWRARSAAAGRGRSRAPPAGRAATPAATRKSASVWARRCDRSRLRSRRPTLSVWPSIWKCMLLSCGRSSAWAKTCGLGARAPAVSFGRAGLEVDPQD